MKFLTFIVLLMLVLAQFLKADTQMSEPEDLNFKVNWYTVYTFCIDGYMYVFYRDTVIQMTQINKESGSSRVTSIPVSCKWLELYFCFALFR